MLSPSDESGSRKASETAKSAGMEAVSSERSLHDVERRLVESWPTDQWRETNVVLAVSGGVDSVALLGAVQAVKASCGGAGRLTVAHLNHGLRGDASDSDAAWLADLCHQRRLDIQIEMANVAATVAEQGDGWEAAARTLRYDFLQRVATKTGARWVVTAHTADDQVETVVHRIFRGTGLSGLAGMRAHRPLGSAATLVRPLLGVRKRELVEYLNVLEQEFRSDCMNDDPRFTRNRIRHGLLPLTRDLFKQDVDWALLRLAGQAHEAQAVIEMLAEQLAETCCKNFFAKEPRQSRGLPVSSASEHVQVVIKCEPLVGEPEIVVREMFRQAWRKVGWPEQAMGFDDWRLLARMASSKDSLASVNLPGNILVRREGTLLSLQRCDLP
jgi:tRNA(Ile)-lysidine synthase